MKPKRLSEPKEQTPLEIANQRLQEAIAEEDYELAIYWRDWIKWQNCPFKCGECRTKDAK
jgi:protein-arginine kinase activator protein McsA